MDVVVDPDPDSEEDGDEVWGVVEELVGLLELARIKGPARFGTSGATLTLIPEFLDAFAHALHTLFNIVQLVQGVNRSRQQTEQSSSITLLCQCGYPVFTPVIHLNSLNRK